MDHPQHPTALVVGLLSEERGFVELRHGARFAALVPFLEAALQAVEVDGGHSRAARIQLLGRVHSSMSRRKNTLAVLRQA